MPSLTAPGNRLRLAVVLLGAVALAVFASDVTTRHLPGRPSPGRQAARAFSENPGAPASADALARRALARSPIDVDAVRTMALVARQKGDAGREARLLGLAEGLSRRDPATQVMLIEAAVGRGDIDAALRHYDRALTVSPSALPILIPRLVAALPSDAVRARLLPMLTAHRPWRDSFLTAVASASLSPALVMAVSRAARLDRDLPADARVLALLVGGLVRAGATPEARALAVPPARAGAIVQDGRFDQPDGIIPFAWRFYNRGGWTVGTEMDGNHRKLVLIASDATSETVADQTIMLSPGRHVLTFRSGSDSTEAAPRVAIVCRADPARVLLDVPAPTTATPASFAFTVASDTCTGYRLRIVGGDSAGEPTRAWISDIAIRAIPPSRPE